MRYSHINATAVFIFIIAFHTKTKSNDTSKDTLPQSSHTFTKSWRDLVIPKCVQKCRHQEYAAYDKDIYICRMSYRRSESFDKINTVIDCHSKPEVPMHQGVMMVVLLYREIFFYKNLSENAVFYFF